MAKGKKASGKHYTSKGQRKSVSQRTLNAMRRERSGCEKMINIQRAWLQGKNPWITIVNPNKEQTNQRFIRVRVNDLNGDPKERTKKMYVMN
jgi:hypothetical protein